MFTSTPASVSISSSSTTSSSSSSSSSSPSESSTPHVDGINELLSECLTRGVWFGQSIFELLYHSAFQCNPKQFTLIALFYHRVGQGMLTRHLRKIVSDALEMANTDEAKVKVYTM